MQYGGATIQVRMILHPFKWDTKLLVGTGRTIYRCIRRRRGAARGTPIRWKHCERICIILIDFNFYEKPLLYVFACY
jgi:hypothetical protein